MSIHSCRSSLLILFYEYRISQQVLSERCDRPTGAPRTVLVEEEPVASHHVHDTPHVPLHRAVLLVVYYRQCALVHLCIVAGQDVRPKQVVYRLELADHRLEPVVDGRGADADSELLVTLYHPVEGQMIAVFAYYDVARRDASAMHL